MSFRRLFAGGMVDWVVYENQKTQFVKSVTLAGRININELINRTT